jgi:hypothetical protein
MCDVYVYEHVQGGWTTHVAGNRRIFGPIPDFFMGGRLSGALHRWSGVYWESGYRGGPTYPHRMRGLIYRAFCRLSSFWHNTVHMGSLRLIPLRPIGLPHDGETFSDETPQLCAERLEGLRRIGYKVPQYAIDALRAEDADMRVVA